MPDISMCTGKECPIKNTCYRYIARPSEYRQSYFMSPPYKPDGSCESHVNAAHYGVVNEQDKDGW